MFLLVFDYVMFYISCLTNWQLNKQIEQNVTDNYISEHVTNKMLLIVMQKKNTITVFYIAYLHNHL